MAQAKRMVNAVQMKHFGNLLAIAATLDDKNPKVLLGYVAGKASGNRGSRAMTEEASRSARRRSAQALANRGV